MCNVCITSRTRTHVHANTHCSSLRGLQSRITSIKLIILLVNQSNIPVFLFIFIIYFMYYTNLGCLKAQSGLGFPPLFGFLHTTLKQQHQFQGCVALTCPCPAGISPKAPITYPQIRSIIHVFLTKQLTNCSHYREDKLHKCPHLPLDRSQPYIKLLIWPLNLFSWHSFIDLYSTGCQGWDFWLDCLRSGVTDIQTHTLGKTREIIKIAQCPFPVHYPWEEALYVSMSLHKRVY